MKPERQALIIQAINEEPISTQDELAAWLKARGCDVTQATISRDIRELRLVKVATADGAYRYAQPSQPAVTDVRRRLMRAFREDVVDLSAAGNLVVVKTLPGSAQSVAKSLDEVALPGVLATLAGDDAILVIVSEPDQPVGPATRSVLDTFWSWRG